MVIKNQRNVQSLDELDDFNYVPKPRLLCHQPINMT